MSSIDKYAQFISNQQKTLESDGKLISEREILINRLMAEGFTSKQIEYMIEQGLLEQSASEKSQKLVKAAIIAAIQNPANSPVTNYNSAQGLEIKNAVVPQSSNDMIKKMGLNSNSRTRDDVDPQALNPLLGLNAHYRAKAANSDSSGGDAEAQSGGFYGNSARPRPSPPPGAPPPPAAPATGAPRPTGTTPNQSSLGAQLRKVGGNAAATSDTAAGRAKIALLDKANPQRDWKKDVFER